MPYREKQKQKILLLAKMLAEETDAEHRLTVQQIITRLAEAGIPAERKGIYDDIGELADFGMEIGVARGRGNEYYLAKRTFELAELKLLADEIKSSRFIPPGKSYELIAKLKRLAGPQADELQVYVDARRKSANEAGYSAVGDILTALQEGKKLSFRYFEYDLSKRLRYRNGGQPYVVSPYDVVWSEGNYYLLADSPAHGLTTYRVDRMEGVRVEDVRGEKREGVDVNAYLAETFSMYSGTREVVELVCDASLITTVLDRFGRDTAVRGVEGGRFAVLVGVQVSPTFYGWCFNFVDKLSIVSPDWVAKEYADRLARTLAGYERK